MTDPSSTPPTSSRSSSRTPILVGVVVIALIAAVTVGVVWAQRSDDRALASWPTPTPTAEGTPAELESFYTQSLDWTDCGRAKCTKVEVPIDYDQPDGDTLELSVRLYPAANGRSERSLFVNPGGPGGSAVDFASSMSGSLGKSVTDVYDVVGVDPRGVGESTPLTCLDDDAFTEFVDTDPDPETPAEISDLREANAAMGEACEANSGELASHVSTHEVAEDMDVVRALLGRDQLDWFGASYGTQIGATYADLFPERVGRMILDGAVDPAATPFESAMGQVTGFQRAFDAYAADCIANDDCPLGGSVKEARATVAGLFDQLDRQPLPAGEGREVTEGQAFYGVALPLYSQQTWYVLTDALTQALEQNNGSTLAALSDAYFERQPDGSYNGNQGQVIYAVNCLDAGTDPTLQEVEAELPRFESVSPVFGRALGWGVLGCTDWPLKSDTPQEPVTAAGAAPIVVVGTTRDPATPYENSVKLAQELESGVLLSRDGDGHTAYNQGNTCIDETLDAYLVDGTVPDDGTKCPA